jgi:hypothetical protein
MFRQGIFGASLEHIWSIVSSCTNVQCEMFIHTTVGRPVSVLYESGLGLFDIIVLTSPFCRWFLYIYKESKVYNSL